MARKEITTPLDLKNMDNHNYNYDELYGLIDETDRRISEDMWEEIKDANTMKMLEPVQTAADLPSEAADKSLITVIDEQRIYGFVNGEWQPFNQIDLDPFEPFKDELSEIVAAYEKQIQNITQEVQSTKDSAIESIKNTQSQISTIRDEMSTQASELTALFNDSMNKLTSKQDTALAEVDSAKQAAIAALEDFNNTDTSNWQKHKLTDDDGTVQDLERGMDLEDEDFLDSLSTGFYYLPSPINPPVGYSGFLTVYGRSAVKVIYFQPYGQDKLSINRYYRKWSGWKKVPTLSLDEEINNWQKYKLTESNGDRISKVNLDVLSLESGFFDCSSVSGVPHDEESRWFIDVYQVSDRDAKLIKATLGYTGESYQRTIYGSSDSGWKKLTGVTRTVLFEGSAKSTGEIINLNTSYENFTELRVKLSRTGGNEIFNYDAESGVGISINYSNVYGDSSDGKLYEMELNKKSPTELEIASQRTLALSGTTSDDSGITILKIWGIT